MQKRQSFGTVQPLGNNKRFNEGTPDVLHCHIYKRIPSNISKVHALSNTKKEYLAVLMHNL